MKRAISMKCTQEQFDSIKDKIAYPIENLSSFDDDMYLTNNYLKTEKVSNFCRKLDEHYETFNADIFLEACGGEVEKVWKGSEMQFKDDCGKWEDCAYSEYRLKPHPDYSELIAPLQAKAKENGMKVIINFEKL